IVCYVVLAADISLLVQRPVVLGRVLRVGVDLAQRGGLRPVLVGRPRNLLTRPALEKVCVVPRVFDIWSCCYHGHPSRASGQRSNHSWLAELRLRGASKLGWRIGIHDLVGRSPQQGRVVGGLGGLGLSCLGRTRSLFSGQVVFGETLLPG